MPIYCVKLRNTERIVVLTADENPEEGRDIGPHDGTLAFTRGDQEVGHFLRSQVIAWWQVGDENTTVL